MSNVLLDALVALTDAKELVFLVVLILALEHVAETALTDAKELAKVGAVDAHHAQELARMLAETLATVDAMRHALQLAQMGAKVLA